MKRLFLTAVVLLLLIAGLEAQSKKVTAAADPWPPFIDDKSSTQGLSLEIIRAAMTTQGYQVEMQFLPWARAEASVKSGEIDIVPDVWMTEERSANLLFSEAYTANQVKFIKKKGDSYEFTGMASLAGKNIGVVRGYGYSDAFNKAANFKRDEAVDTITCIKKMLAGRIDLTLDDQIAVASVIKKTEPKLLDEIDFTKNSLSVNKLYIASGLKNPRSKEIIDAFNKGLAIIKGNGKLSEILNNYGIK
jgi:polar amino acid transport system substrate-binding protein